MLDLIYGRSGELELAARLYLPPPDAKGSLTGGARAAVIDVHGGAWYRGSHLDGAHYCEALAEKGLVVLAIEFRDAARGGSHPDACRDITAGVRYLRLHAAEFGVDPARIGLLGSSSGGHLALLAAIQPDCVAYSGTLINSAAAGKVPDFDDCSDANIGKTGATKVSAAVNAVVALWPVADPLYRYHYAERTDRPELRAGHDAYFGSEAVMAEASVPRIVAGGESQQLPPMFVVQPGEDLNVPREMTRNLVAAWESQGGLVHYGFYPGMPHGFACRPGGLTARCIDDVSGFVSVCGPTTEATTDIDR